jgi:hypothetical protein
MPRLVRSSSHSLAWRRCTLLSWQVLCGNLCSITPMLPGGLGLLSGLYIPLKGSCNRIRLTLVLHDELDDCCMLLHSLAHHPTHIHKIIPAFLTWTGTHNASGGGMGGWRLCRPCWSPLPLATPMDTRQSLLTHDLCKPDWQSVH